MVNIKGSTVVVTGGQRGLGKAIVDEFLQRGAAKVYATARGPKHSDDPRVVSVQLDVTDADSVAALAVTASDAEIVQEPTDQPWGTRDCALRDPSGNLIRIDQPPAARA